METLINLIISAGVTWWFLNVYVYSPKAQIKKYWKEIFKIAAMIGKINKPGDEVNNMELSGFENEIKKRGELINALLYRHFDLEKDQKYIEENKYTPH